MRKNWKIAEADDTAIRALERDLGILPTTARLLINRGLVSAIDAASFLRPDLSTLHDPMLLKGMDAAVERLMRAIRDGERIVVYGDYDVDGTTGAALVVLFLREIGADPVCYIPERLTEGYGLNTNAIRSLADDGARLLITVDCGSSDRTEVEFASTLGVDVIITDHHEVPPDGPPPALAVVNPKQEGCAFPFKGLAGVGVAFNLVMAARMALRSEGWFTVEVPNLKRYLDLVAIGTVADMVPLVGENRILVSYGLKEIAAGARPGVRALMDVAGLGPGPVKASDVGFKIAPRINAAGRVARARVAFDLLTSTDGARAQALAKKLDAENSARQKVEARILDEAVEMVEDGAGDGDRAIVLYSEGWHSGVIGIVASRLVERYSKPVVMIAVDGEKGKGSARGVRAFDMVEGLRDSGHLLERFGGHKAAAGLTISLENIEEFKREFTRYANEVLTDEDLVPELSLDAVVTLGDVTGRLVTEIEGLAPFGCSNREPLLCIEDADIRAARVVGSNHLQLDLLQNGSKRSAIAFGLGRLHPIGGPGYSVAFSPYMDEWNGTRRLKLKVRDLRPVASPALRRRASGGVT